MLPPSVVLQVRIWSIAFQFTSPYIETLSNQSTPRWISVITWETFAAEVKSEHEDFANLSSCAPVMVRPLSSLSATAAFIIE